MGFRVTFILLMSGLFGGTISQSDDVFRSYAHAGEVRGFTQTVFRKNIKGYSTDCKEDPWDNIDSGNVDNICYDRYKVNTFLGIPYAEYPTGDRRFRAPVYPPSWQRSIDGRRYKDACPQQLWKMDYLTNVNATENCLNLNIFMPNETDGRPEYQRKYPVFVWIHGYNYQYGAAHQWPGHMLATEKIVVVTFNYRMNALGFLSTQDRHGWGNYGMRDQVTALKWVKDNIRYFNGDDRWITVGGTDSGAAAVGFHLLSPLTNGLFRQAILMSGSDLSEWAYVDNTMRPKEYGKEIARQLLCPVDDSEAMMECLRLYRSPEEIVNASANIWPRENKDFWEPYSTVAGPFAPVVDQTSNNENPESFLPQTPRAMRNSGLFKVVPVLAGLNKDDGAFLLWNQTKHMRGVDFNQGMDYQTFRDIIAQFTFDRRIRDRDSVNSAIEFEYAYHPNIHNKSATLQAAKDMFGDWLYGSGVDEVLKQHAQANDEVKCYMYAFHFRGPYDRKPKWWGAPHGRDAESLFGFSHMNETVQFFWDWTELELQQNYTDHDRNISDFMMKLFGNFIRSGEPTREYEYFRNVTWLPFRPQMSNLSYLLVDERSNQSVNYKQSHFAFWRDYWPRLIQRYPTTTTPIPTPVMLIEFQAATFGLVGLALLFILIIVTLSVTWWKWKQLYNKEYRYVTKRSESEI
ncbi:unnamed protein product [Owenia fusiformis]|uniref:Uncharacterized protein n=1 Tax=Owenia fusiformis TaxID=6347 RepID=A0A8J1Y0G0_OWEFU|nr:unnamed protein product [Owenia fusiformis]